MELNMAKTCVMYLWAILLFLGKIQCADIFFHFEEDNFMNEEANHEAHSRVKRADVSAIRHLYDESRINEHSQEEKDAILAKHIEYRSRTSPEASNMEYMYWNEELALNAGHWASVCYWGHGMTNHTTSFGNDIGQNLWLGGGKPSGVNTIIAWHDNEKNWYNYEDNSCSYVCGHYTQVVWAKSKEVGCSRAFCRDLIDNQGNKTGARNKWIEACHYAPAGNYVGVRPFRTGPSCTECQSGIAECFNNTCRPCSEHNETCECRQICNNCGTLTSECKCDCMDGWYGPSCSEYCENKDDRCGRSPGWPGAYTCKKHPAIPRNCPLMCGVCEPEGDEVCGTTKAPNATTKASGVTTSSSATTNQSADVTTINPEVTTPSSATSKLKTDVTTKAPEVITTASLATTHTITDVTTKKSEVTTPSSATTELKSNVTTKAPEVISTASSATTYTTANVTTKNPEVTTPSSATTKLRADATTKQSEVTTPLSAETTLSATTREETTRTPEGCKHQCKNKGKLQTDCTCKCLKEYTGKRCERLLKEVENGVEILFVEHISHYTSKFELMLSEAVAAILTDYCNDNFQTCCSTDKNKRSGTFDFIDHSNVFTAQGYPIQDDTQTQPAFTTMIVIRVPPTTDLCENGTQPTDRRRRDGDWILNRRRRADEVEIFFDQNILVEVIETNMAAIEDDLNVTVGEIRAGSVTKTSPKTPKGMNPGIIAGAIVAVLLAVIIVTAIVVIVVKNSNSHKNKTKDKWVSEKDDADPSVSVVQTNITDSTEMTAAQRVPLSEIEIPETCYDVLSNET